MGDKVTEAAFKEMKQLHNIIMFEPIKLAGLNSLERKRAMESLIILLERRNKTIKTRTCANRSTHREYVDREDVASLTKTTDSIIITSIIYAKQGRAIMTADIPNAFVQIDIDQSGKKMIRKIKSFSQ